MRIELHEEMSMASSRAGSLVFEVNARNIVQSRARALGRVLAWLSCASLLLSAHVLAQAPPPGPAVFVSTFTGNQILRVDGNTGATTVIFPNPTSPQLSPALVAEDIVIGPDGNIYICDALGNRIIRMDQTGHNVKVVMATADNPDGPEGPSFSGSGDLYFNTRGSPATHTGVWKISAAQLASLPPDPDGATPTQVFTAEDTGSTFGEGTAFGAADELFVVDRSGNVVLESVPPFSSIGPLITTNLSKPFGIALSNSGEIFVANFDAFTISRFSSTGVFQNVYVDFSATTDDPEYLEFDATGTLYVATAKDSSSAGGKVWRVDPSSTTPGTGVATLLIDLGLAFSTGSIADLSSSRALGLAVAADTREQPLLGFPATNVFTFGNFNFKVKYPENVDVGDVLMEVTAKQVSPADFTTASFPDATCIVYDGTAGKCVIFGVECEVPTTLIETPCPAVPATDAFADAFIEVLTSYETSQTIEDPGFLQCDPSFPTNCVNIITGFSEVRLDPTTSGKTKQFSDFVAVEGTPPVLPRITIASPTETAYTLHQTVLADYGCVDVSGSSGPLTCSGPVEVGMPIDTASLGSKMFTVDSSDNQGRTRSETVTYGVGYASSGPCLGEPGHQILQPINADGTSVFKKGSTVPAKFRVCDANGISVGAPNPVVTSFRLVKTVMGTAMSSVDDAVLSTTPDTAFRWDSSAQQWIFNMSTKGSSFSINTTYFYRITLDDGSLIDFQFGLLR